LAAIAHPSYGGHLRTRRRSPSPKRDLDPRARHDTAFAAIGDRYWFDRARPWKAGLAA
jgi:hypothetical protein